MPMLIKPPLNADKLLASTGSDEFHE